MWQVFCANLRGIFRDRVFHGIFASSLIYLAIPVVSTLSMRQVTELSMTLTLSLQSFILLLLATFLGGTSLWKDIDRRYVFSVASLPISRGQYLLGKFFSVAIFVLLVATVLGLFALLIVYGMNSFYPPLSKPVVWGNLFWTLLFDSLKYVLLIAVAFLFSTVSTSFFLPLFGTIAVFLSGCASQAVFDFIQTSSGQKLPLLVRQFAEVFYYLIPNFSAFDFKLQAIYGLELPSRGLLLTAGYFFVYLCILLTAAVLLFSRRELQ